MIFVVFILLLFSEVHAVSHSYAQSEDEFKPSPGQTIHFNKEQCSPVDIGVWCTLKGEILIDVCGKGSIGSHGMAFLRHQEMTTEDGRQVVSVQAPEVFIEYLCRKVIKVPSTRVEIVPEETDENIPDSTTETTPETLAKKNPRVFNKPGRREIVFYDTECSSPEYSIIICDFTGDLLIEVCGFGMGKASNQVYDHLTFTEYKIFIEGHSTKIIAQTPEAYIEDLCVRFEKSLAEN